jgi:preprotein translocase subunit SecB
MQTSPLQLEESFFEAIKVSPSDLHPSPKGEVKVDVECTYGQNANDANKWLVRICVRFGSSSTEQPAPYEGEINLSGLFSVKEGVTEEKQLLLVAINCPSILYASAREILALITGRSTHGQYLLPSVSFADQRIARPEVEKTAEDGSGSSNTPVTTRSSK